MSGTATAEGRRAFIVEEIRRLARRDGGRAPGRLTFERATGVKYEQWCGVYWARWSDAVVEAGLAPNQLQRKLDSDVVLLEVIDASRHFQHLPTVSEMKLYRRQHQAFPNAKTVLRHFPTKASLAAAVRRLVEADASYADILPMLPGDAEENASGAESGSSSPDGWVYLFKSGKHYKIGRSGNLERRVKEVTVALPENLTIVHTITTDDEAGIENYWHRRFADLRVRPDAEWFKLGPAEVRAFKRRRFM